jgi:hypothetical protein
MKKILLILITIAAFMACKNDAKSEPQDEATDASQQRTEKQSDGLTLLKGEFIYYADAAVLQTHREMYAVIIDDKMHELDNMAKPFKKEATDFVQVEIRGKITPRPENEEGWDYRVEIKEILNVKAAEKSNEVVKLGTE